MNQIYSHQPPGDQSQQQLALDIFASMDLIDVSITDITADFGFRKPKLLVDVSDLGLLARRALNGCFFIAQEDPGAESHTVDLRFFKWIIRYDSNNNAHLKKVLREAQKSAVQVNVVDAADPKDDSWVSVPMIGAAGIRKGRLSFEIPKHLRGQLRDPERYSLLSMRILAGFSSVYALELYERLSQHKHEGGSPWYGIDEFRGMIRVDNLKIANDFRYFKRDILSPAIQQINEISDIEVSLELRRTGRFYSHLRFVIKSSEKHRLATNISASKQLYDTLTKEFGLSDAELDEIARNRATWGDDRLQAAIEFVQHRLTTSKIMYPAKYLMTAVRDGYRIGTIEAESRRTQAAEAEAAVTRAAGNQKALELVRTENPVTPVLLPTGDALKSAWEEFRRSPSAKLFKQLSENYGDASARAKKAFEGYLASNTLNRT